jgi:hypothetical protein
VVSENISNRISDDEGADAPVPSTDDAPTSDTSTDTANEGELEEGVDIVYDKVPA